MWKWLLDNMKWLFSGVGIVVLAFLIQLVSRYFKRRRSRALSAKEQSLPVIIEELSGKSPEDKGAHKPSSLTANAIMTAIQSAPILQRPDVIKNYLGLRVSWEGHLATPTKKADDLIHLQITAKDTNQEGRGGF